MLIFCSYINLDQGNYQELEAIYIAINKNNLIDIDLNNFKS